MDLLFVTDVFPFPPDHGSSVISWNWLRSLVERHRITVLSLGAPPNTESVRQIIDLGARLSSYEAPKQKQRSTVTEITGSAPSAFTRLPVEHLHAAILAEARVARFDGIVLIGSSLAALLPLRGWPAPTVLVPFDSISLNLAAQARVARNPLRRLYALLESRKWARVEEDIYPLSNAVVLVAERDARAVSARWDARAKSRLHVIPNGVDSSYFAPADEAERRAHLVFTGNMGTDQSAYSVTWFLKEIFPKVRRQIPDATFDIVGRNPGDRLTKAARGVAGVRVTGFVPDIRAAIAAATVYVAPLKLGSGIKNRVLEALAMGKAVVATPESVHGLHAELQATISVEADPKPFADAIIALTRDSERRLTIGDAARQAVERHHNWQAVGEKVEGVLAQVAGRSLSETRQE